MSMARTEVRPRSWWRENQQRLTPYVFLIPGVIFFLVRVIIPIFESFRLSGFDWDGLGEKRWIGLANYVELFDDDAFCTSLKNNVIWLLLYMLAVPAGLFIAIFLNRTVVGIRAYKSLFFFPFVISQVVVGLIFAWFYAPNFGLFNILIEKLTGDGVAVLADPDLVTYGIIAAGLWPQIAYCMILYLTGLNAVDPAQVEAARLDNAKGWKMLWYVILPQLRPAIAALSVLIFTFIRNDYFWATVLTTSATTQPVTAGLHSLNGQWIAQWQLVSAGAIVAAMPPVLMFFLIQRHFIAGLTLGAVK